MTTATRSLVFLAAAREDIRTLLREPVMAWVTSPKSRRTDAQYRDLLLIPIDLQPQDGSCRSANTVTRGTFCWRSPCQPSRALTYPRGLPRGLMRCTSSA